MKILLDFQSSQSLSLLIIFIIQGLQRLRNFQLNIYFWSPSTALHMISNLHFILNYFQMIQMIRDCSYVYNVRAFYTKIQCTPSPPSFATLLKKIKKINKIVFEKSLKR